MKVYFLLIPIVGYALCWVAYGMALTLWFVMQLDPNEPSK